MKSKKLVLLAIMGMAIFIFPVVARASEPMSEEEIKIYKKYEGNWGSGAWKKRGGKNDLGGASVEFQIGEIDSANRKAKVVYFWGEAAKNRGAGKRSRMANCVDGKLIFETKKHRFELWVKGNDELFAKKMGYGSYEVILNRIQ